MSGGEVERSNDYLISDRQSRPDLVSGTIRPRIIEQENRENPVTEVGRT